MTFVLATANAGKVKEMQSLLSHLGYDVKSRHELGFDFEIEETGTTFLENATLKADAICKATGLPSIADDSGLMVDALGGAPGVYSSLYGGEQLTDVQRYEYLLENMENTKLRTAKFVCTIVCTFPNGDRLVSEGECKGEIIQEARGGGGFGYDPVFLVSGTDKTMAQLTSEEKNSISHRGEALKKFVLQLQKERGNV